MSEYENKIDSIIQEMKSFNDIEDIKAFSLIVEMTLFLKQVHPRHKTW